MTDSRSDKLAALMKENSLDGETRLFRQTLSKFLTATDDPAMFRISANSSPSEAVIDVYGQGHTCGADQVGAGLAFVETTADEWQGEDRASIEVRLQDVIDQGGLVYPVESVITEKTWYLTLPSGEVAVRKL